MQYLHIVMYCSLVHCRLTKTVVRVVSFCDKSRHLIHNTSVRAVMKDSQVDRVAHTVALTQTAPRLMRYVAQLTTVAGHVSDHLNH